MESKALKIKGSLLGGAIGDALGYQIEFQRGIKEKQVTRFYGKGIISDDTQMTLFTANAIIHQATRVYTYGIGPSTSDAIYLGYLDWYDTQCNYSSNERTYCWIKEIPELNVQRAPGNTCLSALSGEEKGTIDNPINDSKGCGGVMRVAPIGLYYKNIDMVGKAAAEASAITHGHQLGIIPAYVFAAMINDIVYNNSSIDRALINAILSLENSNLFSQEYIDAFEDLIGKAITLSEKNLSDPIAIAQIGEGWVADEALAIAVYSCLKYQNSFEDAVVCSVNHDGDSDSTGSIAGNIIGAYLGINAIPNYYLENLELRDIIEELAYDLSIPVPVSEDTDYTNEYWMSKYAGCHRDLSKIKKEKSCGAVVIKEEQDGIKFLIIKQHDEYWGFPKGHVEEGETEEETAIREIKEETNIDAQIDNNFRKVVTYSPKEGVIKDVVFFIGRATSFDIVIDPHELMDAKWVNALEARDYFIYQDTINVYEEALKYLGVSNE